MGIPILTSNRDFAQFMCREFAIYFDPLSPQSIVDAIERLVHFDKTTYRESISTYVKTFPSNWSEVAESFAKVIEEIL